MPLGFMGTDGELVVPVTAAEVCAYLDRGEQYWHGESGSARLDECRRVEQGWQLAPPTLHMVVRVPLGVHFKYVGADGRGVAAFVEERPGELIEHQLGGNRVWFPASCFVPMPLARQVIEEFVQSGERSALVSWRRGRFVTDSEFAFSDG
jgi:hypothetical protein